MPAICAAIHLSVQNTTTLSAKLLFCLKALQLGNGSLNGTGATWCKIDAT